MASYNDEAMTTRDLDPPPAPQSLSLTTPTGDVFDLELRPLIAEEYPQCEDLQRLTWGQNFNEVVPSSMLKIAHRLGGVVSGAFAPDGRLMGFVHGVTGVRGGELLHWSHMAAVRPELRGCGMGRHLKLYQRREMLAIDCRIMEWTYDPLESRNAHLNLNRLAGEPIEYVRNVYGDGSTSALHQGIGTDRFIISWRLDDPDVEQVLENGPAPLADAVDNAPAVNTDANGRPFDEAELEGWELPDVPVFLVEVPADIQTLKRDEPTVAKAWRAGTRKAFEAALAAGYRIQRLKKNAADSRFFYVAETISR